jgi:hypothetical protein
LHRNKKQLIFVSMKKQIDISISIAQTANSSFAWWQTTSLRWRE